MYEITQRKTAARISSKKKKKINKFLPNLQAKSFISQNPYWNQTMLAYPTIYSSGPNKTREEGE